MLYDGFVTELAKRFQRKFDEIKVVHNFEYGPEFEIAVCEVLRELLPGRAGVCRGYIVARDGTKAGDDIIIFDASRFPTLRSLGENLARKENVPADAVLAYIEAKHTLKLDEDGGQSLAKAMEQVDHVKSLVRARSVGVGIGPKTSISIVGGKQEADGYPIIKNPWYAMILARHIAPDDPANQWKLIERVSKSASDVAHFPDVIVAGPAMALPTFRPTDEQGSVGPGVQLRPFFCETSELAFFRSENIAMGIGVMHLLWAIEWISLRDIPWEEMMVEALQDGDGKCRRPREALRPGGFSTNSQ